MVTLVQGTVEYFLVDVVDRLGAVNTLVGTGPLYNVYRRNDNTQVITNLAAAVDPAAPMQLRCLIDTTNGTTWTSEEYELYVKFTSGLETPEHGPFRFFVEKKNTPG
jgi:hypothetical protein